MNWPSESAFKMLFGFVLLIGLLVLAALFGLGKVHEGESYGLREIIAILAVLGGGFIGWFSGQLGKDKKGGGKDE